MTDVAKPGEGLHVPQGIYVHWKGDQFKYVTLGVAYHRDTNQRWVVYRKCYGPDSERVLEVRTIEDCPAVGHFLDCESIVEDLPEIPE